MPDAFWLAAEGRVEGAPTNPPQYTRRLSGHEISFGCASSKSLRLHVGLPPRIVPLPEIHGCASGRRADRDHPIALVVHARPIVVAIPLAVLARIIPSSVRHRPSFARVALVGLSVKTPWQCLRGSIQGSAESPRRVSAAINAWSVGDPLGAAEGDRAWLRRRTSATKGLLRCNRPA